MTIQLTPGPAGRTLAHATAVLTTATGTVLTAQITTATLAAGDAEYSTNPVPAAPAPEQCLAAPADGREPDPVALLLFADALPPTSFGLGRLGWAPTVQLLVLVLVRALPAPGWVLVEARSSELAGGWTDEEYRIWDSTGRLVAQSRQLARLPR